MKCHYFIIKQQLVMGVNIVTDRELIHRIRDVLKLRPGEKVVLSDGVGNCCECEIGKLGNKEIEVSVVETKSQNRNKKVVLYCAIIKKDNFELVAQKAAEIGVTKIVPILTDRTIKKDLNLNRLEKIVLEAAEQAENCWVPEIGEIVEFKKVIKNLTGEKILFDASGGQLATYSPLAPLSRREGDVSIFIGPEGGWSERELEMAKENNFKILNLGKNILRAETAVVVASWIFCNSGL